MSERMDGYAALTDKEKQTLRLILRGHDAKSIARHLDLSVHTVNERLRVARRKLAVSSSREAARLLLGHEGTPESFGNKEMGAAAGAGAEQGQDGPRIRVARSALEGVLMMFALGVFALSMLSQSGAVPTASPSALRPADAEVVQTAQSWLALLDQGRWQDSYAGTATRFRKMNTVAAWTSASQKARVPLGAVQSRTLIGQDTVPAEVNGVEVLKFRTRFTNKVDAVETVSLTREDGRWRIVGIYID